MRQQSVASSPKQRMMPTTEVEHDMNSEEQKSPKRLCEEEINSSSCNEVD